METASPPELKRLCQESRDIKITGLQGIVGVFSAHAEDSRDLQRITPQSLAKYRCPNADEAKKKNILKEMEQYLMFTQDTDYSSSHITYMHPRGEKKSINEY